MQYLIVALLAVLSVRGGATDSEALPDLAARPSLVAPHHAIAGDSNRRLSDAEIRKLLIKASIDAYDGNCPCPYNRARNGSRCGKRSAYDREGGEEPLCFDRDVSAEMVREFREARGDR